MPEVSRELNRHSSTSTKNKPERITISRTDRSIQAVDYRYSAFATAPCPPCSPHICYCPGTENKTTWLHSYDVDSQKAAQRPVHQGVSGYMGRLLSLSWCGGKGLHDYSQYTWKSRRHLGSAPPSIGEGRVQVTAKQPYYCTKRYISQG